MRDKNLKPYLEDFRLKVLTIKEDTRKLRERLADSRNALDLTSAEEKALEGITRTFFKAEEQLREFARLIQSATDEM